MKRILVLSLTLSLLFIKMGNVSAAPNRFTGTFQNPFLLPDYRCTGEPTFEDWYYIKKNSPSATVRGFFPKSGNAFGLEYFLNDQTFVDLTNINSQSVSGNSTTFVKGGYLFNNNFFVGLDYGASDHFSQITLSPGYRINLDKNAGYVAVSLDYAASNEYYVLKEQTSCDSCNHPQTTYLKDYKYGNCGIIDMEFDARYYTKKSRVYGQMIIPNQSVSESKEIFFYAGGAYQLSNCLIFGGNFSLLNGGTTYDLGCSMNFSNLGTEVKILGDSENTNSFDINCLYSLTKKMRAGLELINEQNVGDPYLIVKAKYSLTHKKSIIVMYKFKNTSAGADADAVTYLHLDFALK